MTLYNQAVATRTWLRALVMDGCADHRLARALARATRRVVRRKQK